MPPTNEGQMHKKAQKSKYTRLTCIIIIIVIVYYSKTAKYIITMQLSKNRKINEILKTIIKVLNDDDQLMMIMKHVTRNSLPDELRDPVCGPDSFKQFLKTILFSHNLVINVTIALEVFLNDIRYTNPRFTYLLADCRRL